MDTRENQPAAEPGQTPTPPSPDRRRLLLGGVVSSTSVLMTVTSRPVLGGQCVFASAFASLSGSVHVRNVQTCSGLTPTKWNQYKSFGLAWPQPYCPPPTAPTQPTATAYHSLTTGLGGSSYSGKTMYDVCGMTSTSDRDVLARHVAAALLNARSGRTPILGETQIRKMWNDWVSTGSYSPATGQSWNATQIIAYLKSTMA